MRRALLGVVAVCLPAVAVVVAACSTQASLVGAGGQCFQATDCQEGLACIPQKGGQSVCSSDFSSVANEEDSGAVVTPPMVYDANGIDSPAPETDGSAPPPTDASTPPADANQPVDANQPPPVDANKPVDANQPPPVDANQPPPVDANTPDDSATD